MPYGRYGNYDLQDIRGGNSFYNPLMQGTDFASGMGAFAQAMEQMRRQKLEEQMAQQKMDLENRQLAEQTKWREGELELKKEKLPAKLTVNDFRPFAKTYELTEEDLNALADLDEQTQNAIRNNMAQSMGSARLNAITRADTRAAEIEAKKQAAEDKIKADAAAGLAKQEQANLNKTLGTQGGQLAAAVGLIGKKMAIIQKQIDDINRETMLMPEEKAAKADPLMRQIQELENMRGIIQSYGPQFLGQGIPVPNEIMQMVSDLLKGKSTTTGAGTRGGEGNIGPMIRESLGGGGWANRFSAGRKKTSDIF